MSAYGVEADQFRKKADIDRQAWSHTPATAQPRNRSSDPTGVLRGANSGSRAGVTPVLSGIGKGALWALGAQIWLICGVYERRCRYCTQWPDQTLWGCGPTCGLLRRTGPPSFFLPPPLRDIAPRWSRIDFLSVPNGILPVPEHLHPQIPPVPAYMSRIRPCGLSQLCHTWRGVDPLVARSLGHRHCLP